MITADVWRDEVDEGRMRIGNAVTTDRARHVREVTASGCEDSASRAAACPDDDGTRNAIGMFDDEND